MKNDDFRIKNEWQERPASLSGEASQTRNSSFLNLNS